MPALRSIGADQVVDRRLAGGRAVLAVGVGMHVMFSEVVQDGTATEGLEWAGVVDAVDAPPGAVGSRCRRGRRCSPVSRMPASTSPPRTPPARSRCSTTGPRTPAWSSPLVTWSPGDERFVVAVENGPLVGLQMRPESSGERRRQVLARWVSSLPTTAPDLPE